MSAALCSRVTCSFVLQRERSARGQASLAERRLHDYADVNKLRDDDDRGAVVK